MATALPNTNINIPYSAFLDPTTGRPSQPWLQWLMNPSVMSINIGSAIGVTAGGTGLTTIPTNGQLLIGNGTGYTLNTLGAGAGISITNGSGTITVANTGVRSVTGTAPVMSTGGQTPAISLASGYGDTQNPYAAKTANYVLAGPASGAAAVPTFRSLVVADIPALPYAPQTSGTSILYGNGTGGFSNVTIGSGISFVSGTLSATGSGGTVTSVGGTGTVNGLTLTGTVTSSGNLTLGGTLDLSSPPAIGGTTAAAGTFTTLIGGADAANYGQLTGGATTKAVQFQTLGTDTNISVAVQPKGTGAIDLAAGSRGVNISNGGTVTAITRTAAGLGYTSVPTVNITAPTTAGGVQAVITIPSIVLASPALNAGGTGYTVGDVLTLVGGTFTIAATVTVSTVSSGVITAVSISNNGVYTIAPTTPVSVTGGTGSGATFNSSFGINSNFSIGTAGSGYVEQPTVTFSGGGGSGAAAYATVGSATSVKSLHTNMNFYTPNGSIGFSVTDDGTSTSQGYLQTRGTNSVALNFVLGGSTSNTGVTWVTRGTGSHLFSTNGSPSTTQLAVTHTASAVNYVQVTGGATGAAPVMSAQGSDAAVGLTFNTKSTGVHTFQTNGTTRLLINSGGTVQLGYANATPCFTAIGVASQVNGFQAAGSVAGSAPSLSSTGTDADIDLTLTPKGAGRVNITTSIKPKVNSTTSVASPLAWNSTSYDEYALTALANALTISADANTAPADGQRMMFRFKDNGTAQTLTWTTGSARAFRVVGVTLPTTTVASKLLYVGCIYNAADSRWDAIAVGQEA